MCDLYVSYKRNIKCFCSRVRYRHIENIQHDALQTEHHEYAYSHRPWLRARARAGTTRDWQREKGAVAVRRPRWGGGEVSCAEHAVHQTKNDEPRWGPDGGQKHATRPRAQALRAPRLNDSPSLSFATSARCCACARSVCTPRLRRVHPRVPR